MDCQLWSLRDGGRPATALATAATRARLEATVVLRRVRKVAHDPALLLTRAGGWLARRKGARNGAGIPEVVALARLGLQAGERVRVRSWSEIEATLDEHRTCQGLGWMVLMRDFCGTEHTVLRRVDRFFDERRHRMVTVRDVVLLDGVYCQPPPDALLDYAGCTRMCFLFWKEAWLERCS